MAINSEKRKLRNVILGMLAIFAIYFIYVQFIKKHNFQNKPVQPGRGDIADLDATDPNEEYIVVDGVKISSAKKARFTTINPKTKLLDREFGFDTVLHDEGEQWEIEKPYMNIHRPGLICYIKADKGFVEMETDVSPPNPKDALLTGNVVAHIVPKPGSSVKESFINLEGLSFDSSRSTFTAPGKVEFISDNAYMSGSDLTLIYDDENNRLNLFRIEKLNDLRFTVDSGYKFAQENVENKGKVAINEDTETSDAGEKSGYKAILDGDVLIDAGDKLIAAEQVSISNIIWSDDSPDKPDQNMPVDNNEMGANSAAVLAKNFTEKVLPEDAVQIKVSCTNGIVMVPADSLETLNNIEGFANGKSSPEAVLEKIEQAEGQTIFVAQTVDYDFISEDASAMGLSKLRFYIKDFFGDKDSDFVIPATVTSYDNVTFSPKSNSITFEGNCRCRMARFEKGFLQEYLLSAPRLDVNLASEEINDTNSIADVETITAWGKKGQLARLSSVKKIGNDNLGGIELKSPKFVFDAADRVFSAFGPGVVKADNSKIPQPSKDVGRFSMQRPCYAIVRNFDSLNYFLDDDKFVAVNKEQRMFIDYFPIMEEGREQVSVTAGKIEAEMVKTAEGKVRLWTLLADNGISYEESDKLFEGGSFLYNDQKSLITAKGSKDRPLFFNGVLFDGLEYDLKTDEIRDVEISGPGYFHVNR